MSEFTMISFPCLLLLLAGCVAGYHRGMEDISIRCERIVDQKSFNLLCNLTDNRDSNPSCPPKSLLIPRFSPITIKCAVGLPFPFKQVQCKMIDLYGGKTSDKEILKTNATFLFNALEHNERVLDGLVKFERILSNALAIGEALIRCKNSMFNGENDLFRCSLFGIGDKASVNANMSCSSASSFSAQTYTMTMIQCGFSEDHQSAKVRGNMTLALKFFNDGMRMAADVLFSARSNSPLQNVMETVRLGCHVSPVDGIQVCGAYLNEGRFCDNPVCCEDKEGTSSIRDRVWELDRTLVFDVEQKYFGKANFTCNLADDVQAKILKCSLHYANGSIVIDIKSIFDVTAINGSVVINSVELVLINASNRITYKNILGRLQCQVQNPQSKSTIYSVTCTFPLLPNYFIEGNLTDSNKDPTKIAITFDGQLRAANKPGGLHLNSFCSADILAPMTRVNAKCMVDFGTNDELCEMFVGNATFCKDGLLATLLKRL